jgi:HD superfamily phosphohydrolase
VLDRDLAQDVAFLIHCDVLASSWMDTIEAKAPTLSRVLRLMIAGEVDCDRMDYLLRDSYSCGVAYGDFDMDWLISSMEIVETDRGFALAIAENGVRAFESFLLARYHMFDQVYFHKTKAGFIHYLEQAILTREIPLAIPTDPYAYADLRDGAVIELMFEAARRPENYWSSHLVRRIPARRVLRLQESRPEDVETLHDLERKCTEQRIRHFVHRAGKELTSIDSADQTTFVEKKTLRGNILVPIFQYSDLLQKYNEKLSIADFFILREDADRFNPA